jgi:hypothetical protein
MMLRRVFVAAGLPTRSSRRRSAPDCPRPATSRPSPNAGALFTYGLDDRARIERAAYFIDRIVKGTKPADLPIELPTEFALIVNRKAAATLSSPFRPA